MKYENVYSECFIFRSVLQKQSQSTHEMRNTIRPAVDLSQNMRKRSRNAKNESGIVEYFMSLFSHFATIHARIGICVKSLRIS